MPARFKKPDWWVEPDGFDEKALYQMIPFERRRAMSIITDNQDWVLIVHTRSSIKLMDISGPPMKLISIADGRDVYSLPRNATIQFSMEGALIGKSALILQRRDGSLEGASRLKVNIKRLSKPTYKCYRLVDIVGQTTATPDHIFKSALQSANKRLFDEANVQPVLVNSPHVEDGEQMQGLFETLKIPRDYKNGVSIDTESDAEWAFWRTQVDLSSANYFLIFSWNLVRKTSGDIAGLEWGPLVFIEPALSWSLDQVFLHEIGHAYGLDHTAMGASIMQPMVSSPVVRFNEKEIDTLNAG